MKDLVQEVKREFLKALQDKFDIEDEIIIKIKKLPKKAIAMYRSNTQFRSKPIFWIAEDLPDKIEEGDPSLREVIYDSVIHEYGHVILEFVLYQVDRTYKFIQEQWENDEEFSEDFIPFFKNEIVRATAIKNYERVIKSFRKHCFE